MTDMDERGPVLHGSVEASQDPDWRDRAHPTADGPEWRVWGWTSGGPPGRGAATWLGAILIVLGLIFLAEQLIPAFDIASLLILALGLAFGAAWLLRGVIGATVPALVLTAWGLARITEGLGPVSSGGWTPLFVGVALLIARALAPAQGARREWTLWLGAFLAIVGLVDVLDLLPGLLDAELVIGVAIIALGIAVILRRPTVET